MTAPVPDHAALPVEQLRALLAVPPKWPEHLECGHCGDIAIYADAEELYWDGAGGRCLSCGFPGHVDADEGRAEWRIDDEEGALCSDSSCVDCEDFRG